MKLIYNAHHTTRMETPYLGGSRTGCLMISTTISGTDNHDGRQLLVVVYEDLVLSEFVLVRRSYKGDSAKLFKDFLSQGSKGSWPSRQTLEVCREDLRDHLLEVLDSSSGKSKKAFPETDVLLKREEFDTHWVNWKLAGVSIQTWPQEVWSWIDRRWHGK